MFEHYTREASQKVFNECFTGYKSENIFIVYFFIYIYKNFKKGIMGPSRSIDIGPHVRSLRPLNRCGPNFER